MKYLEKFIHVFIPYFLLTIGFLGIWLFSYQWLVIEWNIIPVKEFTLSFIIPFCIIFPLAYFLLRPRLKVYYGETDKLLLSLTIFMLTICCFIFTMNLSKEGELIELNDLEEVVQYPNEKYFQIDSYEINSMIHASEVRYNIDKDLKLNINVFCVSPFQSEANIWFGKNYFLSIKKPKDKIDFINQYHFQKFDEFKNGALGKPIYFEQIRYSDHYDGFQTAINKVEKGLNPIILEAKFEPFEDRFGNVKNIGWYFLGAFSFIFFLISIFSKAHRFNYLRWRIEKRSNSFWGKSSSILNPFGRFGLLTTIGGISIISFLIQIIFFGISPINPTEQELAYIGGLQYSDLENGKYWHLLIFPFVTIGMNYLLMELLSLSFVSFSGYINKDKTSTLVSIFFIGTYVGAFLTITVYQNMMVLGLFFGIMSVFGFRVIQNYLSEYPIWLPAIILTIVSFLIFYNEPTYIIGGITSFITGILLYFYHEK